jgi:hypothetical protein
MYYYSVYDIITVYMNVYTHNFVCIAWGGVTTHYFTAVNCFVSCVCG